MQCALHNIVLFHTWQNSHVLSNFSNLRVNLATSLSMHLIKLFLVLPTRRRYWRTLTLTTFQIFIIVSQFDLRLTLIIYKFIIFLLLLWYIAVHYIGRLLNITVLGRTCLFNIILHAFLLWIFRLF